MNGQNTAQGKPRVAESENIGINATNNTSQVPQEAHNLPPNPQTLGIQPTVSHETPSFAPTPDDQAIAQHSNCDQLRDGFSENKQRVSSSEESLRISSTGPSGTQNQQSELQADSANTERDVELDDFNLLSLLDIDTFGKVMLAEAKINKQLYAFKIVKKQLVLNNNEAKNMLIEKRIFLLAKKERHPFLHDLHACFQNESRIFFVTEYVSGGNLMLHIQKRPFGFKRSQLYAAEICLALKHLHENRVIHRNLKLDSVLLNLDGHIKLTNYNFCKEDMWYGSTTRTFCGTAEFMAPEILLDKEYGRAVDWWQFGVIVYQMLLQQSPFRGEDDDEIYDAILSEEPVYPIHMPRDWISMIRKLLEREPQLRLGSGPTDAEEIMSHAFFRNVNWEDIYHKRVTVPYLPTVNSRVDTSNFDPEFTSVAPVLSPTQSVLSQTMQDEFRGFSYSAGFSGEF